MAGAKNPLKKIFKLIRPYTKQYTKPIDDKIQFISDHDITPKELSDLITHKIQDAIHHDHETEEDNFGETE